MGLDNNSNSMAMVKYLNPRGMLGLRSEMLSATQGTTVVASVFDSYREKFSGDILSRDKGVLLAFEFEDDVVASRVCE